MKLEVIKIETLWRSDEARGQYELLEKTRADLAAAYGIDMSSWPREQLDIEVSSATELMRRQRRYWTPDREAQALAEYQRAAEPINKAMVALYSQFTTPKITINKKS